MKSNETKTAHDAYTRVQFHLPTRQIVKLEGLNRRTEEEMSKTVETALDAYFTSIYTRVAADFAPRKRMTVGPLDSIARIASRFERQTVLRHDNIEPEYHKSLTTDHPDFDSVRL